MLVSSPKDSKGYPLSCSSEIKEERLISTKRQTIDEDPK